MDGTFKRSHHSSFHLSARSLSIRDEVRVRVGYWLIALIRAIVAFVVGGLVSLDQNHTAGYGLIMFSVFATLNAVIVVWGGLVQADHGVRPYFYAEGVIGVAAGISAIVRPGEGLGMFFFAVTAWALLSGVTETLVGLRGHRNAQHRIRQQRRATGSVLLEEAISEGSDSASTASAGIRASASRDWLYVGIFTVILGIVFLAIPSDPVLSVGLFGAYAAIVGVYIGIGAFSLKWAQNPSHDSEVHA